MKRTQMTALAVVLVGVSLAAQESVGTVTGVVKAADGRVIAGTRVNVKAPQLLGERVVITNADGSYRLSLLPPGDYTISVSKDGFVGSKGMFRLGAGSVMRQDFTMRAIQQQGAVVEVIATSATFDKTETKTVTSFSEEALADLPLGLNSYAALALAPGITGASGYEQIRGGIAGQAVYQVNGISVRDPMVRQGRQSETVLDDSIEDIQVIQSPLNARYGMTSSGIVNATTKNGSNEFTGVFRAKLYRNSWTALRPGGRNALGVAGPEDAPQTDELQRTYEVFVSGPIIKDHLTFTYSGRFTPTTVSTQQLDNPFSMSTGSGFYTFNGDWTTAVPAYNYGFTSGGQSVLIGGKNVDKTQQFKLFWQISTQHQLEYFYTENIPTYFSRQQMSSGPNATGFLPNNVVDDFQSSDAKFYGFNYRGMMSANSSLDVRYGFKKSHVKFPGGPGDPIRVSLLGDPTQDASQYTDFAWVNGTPGSLKAEKRDSQTIAANYNLILDTRWGSHNMDMGVEQLKEITFSPAQAPNGATFAVPGQYDATSFMVFNYVGSRYQLGLPDPNGGDYSGYEPYTGYIPSATQYVGAGADAVKTTSSAYVNDLWSINKNWSLMAGLRYDNGKGTDAIGERYKYTAFMPRFEVKWDITGDSSRVVNFSYGQFRGTIGQSTMALYSVGEGATTVRRFWNQGSVLPHSATLAEVTNIANYGYVYSYSDPSKSLGIDKGLKPENANEMNLGYRRGYAGGGFLRLTAIYRKYSDLIAQAGFPIPTVVPDPTGSGLPSQTTYYRELTNDSKGKREYKGVEFEWMVPITKQLTFQGNWTYGRMTGTQQFKEGNVGSGAAFFWNEMAARGYNNWNPEGVLPDSRDHVIKGWLGYSTNWGKVESVVSLLGRYRSGTHFSMTNTTSISPAMGTGMAGLPTTVPYYYGNRGAWSNPDYLTFDLQYNLKVPIAKKLQFFSSLSVNNCFNQIRQSGVNTPTATATRSLAAAQSGMAITQAPNFGWANANTMYQGARGVNIDLGLKF